MSVLCNYVLHQTDGWCLIPNVNIRYFSYNKILLVILRQIKMSSPNLNNLIIVGCLLCYSSVIILGLDSSLTSEPAFRYICTVKVLPCKLWQTVSRLAIMIVQASSFYLHLKAWVLMAGFTLSFGSMFSKTWRVHSIFTNVQLNKKVCKETRNASHMTSLLEHQPNILFRYFISWFWLAYILYFRRVFFILQSREPQLA